LVALVARLATISVEGMRLAVEVQGSSHTKLHCPLY
jgi:hypothetical protein